MTDKYLTMKILGERFYNYNGLVNDCIIKLDNDLFIKKQYVMVLL